jgi:hypothetical protein
LIRQFTWLLLGLNCLQALVRNEGDALVFLRVFVYVLVSFDTLVLILHAFNYFGFYRFYSFLAPNAFGGWNGLCLLSSLTACFLVFGQQLLGFSRPISWLFSLVLMSLSLPEQSRSGLAASAVIFTLIFLRAFFLSVENWVECTRLRITLKALALILVGIIGVRFGSEMLGRQLSSFAIVGSRPLAALTAEVHSSFSRYFSAVMVLERFLQSPLSGVGFGPVAGIKVAGYPCHTLWAIVMGSYGLVGISGFAIVGFCTFSLGKLRANIWAKLGLIAVVAVVASTTNDVWLWYLLLFVPRLRFSRG